jgi:hypothetical protein
MVASLSPLGSAEGPVAIDLDDTDAPGILLERGLRHFSSSENAPASAAFQAAISTGRLNDAGRALAYWHIFVAEQRAGDVDDSTNALQSFVAVAEEILEARDEVRYAVSESGDFVDRFEVEDKLDRGRAILSATWAGRNANFGRTAERPVPIHTPSELTYFLELASPCTSEGQRSVSRRALQPNLEQVTLSCASVGSVEYYFSTW